ncbi:MAG: hypothetical protein AAGJ94_07600, partial [Pseudomonadota bacterium]
MMTPAWPLADGRQRLLRPRGGRQRAWLFVCAVLAVLIHGGALGLLLTSKPPETAQLAARDDALQVDLITQEEFDQAAGAVLPQGPNLPPLTDAAPSAI